MINLKDGVDRKKKSNNSNNNDTSTERCRIKVCQFLEKITSFYQVQNLHHIYIQASWLTNRQGSQSQ